MCINRRSVRKSENALLKIAFRNERGDICLQADRFIWSYVYLQTLFPIGNVFTFSFEGEVCRTDESSGLTGRNILERLSEIHGFSLTSAKLHLNLFYREGRKREFRMVLERRILSVIFFEHFLRNKSQGMLRFDLAYLEDYEKV